MTYFGTIAVVVSTIALHPGFLQAHFFVEQPPVLLRRAATHFLGLWSKNT